MRIRLWWSFLHFLCNNSLSLSAVIRLQNHNHVHTQSVSLYLTHIASSWHNVFTSDMLFSSHILLKKMFMASLITISESQMALIKVFGNSNLIKIWFFCWPCPLSPGYLRLGVISTCVFWIFVTTGLYHVYKRAAWCLLHFMYVWNIHTPLNWTAGFIELYMYCEPRFFYC